MTLAVLSVGTAVPEVVVDQDEALRVARSLACPTDEQDTWLPGMYAGTRIRRRHFALPPDVVRDVLAGTRHTGSPWLPTGDPADRGPSTAFRMGQYAALAPALALKASAVSALTLEPHHLVRHRQQLAVIAP